MELVDIGIYLTYFMVVVAIVGVMVFSLLNMIKQPKNNKKTLIYIGGLAIVLLLGFIFASSEILPEYKKYEITSSLAKNVGAGLNAFYFLSVCAVLAVLYTEFSKIFSK